MKLLLVGAMLLVCVTAGSRLQYENYFKEWKQFYEKEYESFEEEEMRLSIWMKNWEIVTKHNLDYKLQKKTFQLSMNRFADRNSTEFTSQMNGYRNDLRKNRQPGVTYLNLLSITNESLPEVVDWRTKGYVTHVKNQGHCGSCWAFSTTGSLEGQHYRKTGKLVSLSEQNLIDCSRPEGNIGCHGGLMDSAFKYIKEQGGIDTEKSYPYRAKDETCEFKKKDIGAEDIGYVDISSGDEQQLKEASATIGPISVAIDASSDMFQLYSGGILDIPGCSSTQLDHGVLVVGYGTDDGQDYWLVKNSWGDEWGMKGYMKMSRNKDNQCGIATAASYPLV